MNSFTKHRITVFGINGCHDAIKSSIIDVNQIIIERNSPADISEKFCNKHRYTEFREAGDKSNWMC